VIEIEDLAFAEEVHVFVKGLRVANGLNGTRLRCGGFCLQDDLKPICGQ
jgi:hypothetical protein